MQLSLSDRIILPTFFPAQGSYAEGIIKRDILKKITLTQDELTKYEVKTEGQSVTWKNPEAKFTYEFTDLEVKFIKDLLNQLDKHKELPNSLIECYEAFNA